MLSDIEIAQQAAMQPILTIANALGLDHACVEQYGHYKAKVDVESMPTSSVKRGKLILVTAISPTPAGEGKTTTTVGLGDALRHLGKKSIVCLREPALGPMFGMKGGAAGGGFAQAVPMEDINLHFTGDFAAIAAAHNLLAAMIDNHIHHGNALQIDPRQVTWKRVVDMNDRALRKIVVGLGGKVNGQTREDGFDIVVASEVMAIFCLAQNLQDLKSRLARIVIGYTFDDQPVTASDLQAHGAMTVLLKQALKPNLVQTIENTPALIHGGPFANIAHGCNSVIATQLGLRLADYVVTEAGFGADLGAEKFIDIKCRKSGLRPDACVVVATIRALKFHGGVAVSELNHPNHAALEAGLVNLEKHVFNVTKHYGLPCVVAINRFQHDTMEELSIVQAHLDALGVKAVLAEHWSQGGAGALALAEEIVRLTESGTNTMQFVYRDAETLWDKARAVATKIYGAADISAARRIKVQIDRLQEDGYGHFPICMAKTQYSFSTDAALKGAPTGHVVSIREVRLSAGAEFIVMVCDDIMTMPGLPKQPCATRIDIDENGKTIGLS